MDDREGLLGVLGSNPLRLTAAREIARLVAARREAWMGVGKRAEEHCVYNREGPGCGADAEHQAQDRGCGEAQILAHHARCELQILPERFHR